MTTNEFDAKTLAVAWFSASLASGTDKDIPVLNSTLLLEEYEQGVRIIATDRYMLLHAFAPNIDHKPDDAPDLDIAPLRSVVAIDSAHRSNNLLGYLLGKAKAIEKDENSLDEAPLLTLDLAAAEAEDGAMAFEGLGRHKVALDYEGRERVTLDIFGGDYPVWRGLLAGFKSVKTNNIGLNPAFLGRLGRLGKLHNGSPVIWTFGGENKVAHLNVLTGSVPVGGLIMPVRWEPGASYVKPKAVDAADAVEDDDGRWDDPTVDDATTAGDDDGPGRPEFKEPE